MIFIDRCCALIFALRYYEIVTKRFLLFTCVCIWIFSFLLIYFMFHDTRSQYGIYCGILYLTRRDQVNIISRLIGNHFALQHLLIYLPIYQRLGSFLQKYWPNFKRCQWSHPETIRDNGIFSGMLQSIHYHPGSPRNSLWFYVFWNNPCGIPESYAAQ